MGVRLANLDGAAQLVADGGVIDIATRSSGSLPGDPMELLGRLMPWRSAAVDASEGKGHVGDVNGKRLVMHAPTPNLGPPVPDPPSLRSRGCNWGSTRSMTRPACRNSSAMAISRRQNCSSAPWTVTTR